MTKHLKRKLLRLKGYDYSSESAYFVTIRTKDKKEIFGQVNNEKVFLNKPGNMIESWWKKIEFDESNPYI